MSYTPPPDKFPWQKRAHGPRRWRFTQPPHDSPVPCDGCTLCCQGAGPVGVLPEYGDDPTQYECDLVGENSRGFEVYYLRKKGMGDCVYLDREKGCTVWDRRPAICRSFDCAVLAQNEPIDCLAAVEVDIVSPEILDRGREQMRNGYTPNPTESEIKTVMREEK